MAKFSDKNNRLKAGLTTGIGVLGILGLSLAAHADDPRPLHQLHQEDAELSCNDCHQADAKRPGQMTIKAESCADCHDATPANKVPKHRRLKAAFPHSAHSGFDCTDCHADMAKEQFDTSKPVLSEARCASCHDENGVEIAKNDCRKCHGRNERKVKPADHSGAWLRQHGRESRWRVHGEHGKDCTLCHQERACQACHLTRLPADHGALWRARMHGSAASWDRERCKTCHETGTCLACHRSASPPSHRGDWVGRHGKVAQGFDNNCQVCHRRSQCIACHRQERQ